MYDSGGKGRGGMEGGGRNFGRGRGSFRDQSGSMRGQGGTDRGRGRFMRGRGSINRGRGGFTRGRGGIDRGRGGFMRGRGGFVRGRGGIDRGREGFNSNQGRFQRDGYGYKKRLRHSQFSRMLWLFKDSAEVKNGPVFLGKTMSDDQFRQLLKEKTENYDNIKHMFEDFEEKKFPDGAMFCEQTLPAAFKILTELKNLSKEQSIHVEPGAWEKALDSGRKERKIFWEAILNRKKPLTLQEALDSAKCFLVQVSPKRALAQIYHPHFPEKVEGSRFILRDEFHRLTGGDPPVYRRLESVLSMFGHLFVSTKLQDRVNNFNRELGDLFIKEPRVFPAPHLLLI